MENNKDKLSRINLRQFEEELTQSGFPLELQCVRTLLKRNWDVRNNFIFEDPEQEKHREIDVIACDAPSIFDDASCLTVYLLIECKKRGRPWIFFPSCAKFEKVILGLNDMIFRDGESKRGQNDFGNLVSDLRWSSRFNKGKISSWFFEMGGGKNGIYDAICKLAKASNYTTEGQREGLEPMQPPLLYIVYYAIVFDGLLCNASLSGKKIHLSPTKHVTLGINFICPNFRTHMLIDVIKSEYFPKYIKTIEEERNKFAEIANEFYRNHPKLKV